MSKKKKKLSKKKTVNSGGITYPIGAVIRGNQVIRRESDYVCK